MPAELLAPLRSRSRPKSKVALQTLSLFWYHNTLRFVHAYRYERDGKGYGVTARQYIAGVDCCVHVKINKYEWEVKQANETQTTKLDCVR